MVQTRASLPDIDANFKCTDENMAMSLVCGVESAGFDF